MQNLYPPKLISKGFQAPSKEVQKAKLDLSGSGNRNMDFCLLKMIKTLCDYFWFFSMTHHVVLANGFMLDFSLLRIKHQITLEPVFGNQRGTCS